MVALFCCPLDPPHHKLFFLWRWSCSNSWHCSYQGLGALDTPCQWFHVIKQKKGLLWTLRPILAWQGNVSTVNFILSSITKSFPDWRHTTEVSRNCLRRCDLLFASNETKLLTRLHTKTKKTYSFEDLPYPLLLKTILPAQHPSISLVSTTSAITLSGEERTGLVPPTNYRALVTHYGHSG